MLSVIPEAAQVSLSCTAQHSTAQLNTAQNIVVEYFLSPKLRLLHLFAGKIHFYWAIRTADTIEALRPELMEILTNLGDRVEVTIFSTRDDLSGVKLGGNSQNIQG
jgi:hypothetical protein